MVLLSFENKTENFLQHGIYNLLIKGKHRSIFQIYPVVMDISW